MFFTQATKRIARYSFHEYASLVNLSMFRLLEACIHLGSTQTSSEVYDIYTRTRNSVRYVYNVHTVPGASVSYVRPCVRQIPGTSVGSVRLACPYQGIEKPYKLNLGEIIWNIV